MVPVVRKLDWNFDGVPFQWQPYNPHFGLFANTFSFMVVPFEQYIVRVAQRLPEVDAETEAFVRQEGQHSRAHRKHMTALIDQYPRLERCFVLATESYNRLLKEKPLEYHVAHIATIEVVSQPMYQLVLDNHGALFDGGDARVAALMTWHFVEEIEHRSSGLKLCQQINPNPWYRTRNARATVGHWNSLSKMIEHRFDEVVPPDIRGASALRVMEGLLRRRGLFRDVPLRDVASMALHTLASFLPKHDPDELEEPVLTHAWKHQYELGSNMTR